MMNKTDLDKAIEEFEGSNFGEVQVHEESMRTAYEAMKLLCLLDNFFDGAADFTKFFSEETAEEKKAFSDYFKSISTRSKEKYL